MTETVINHQYFIDFNVDFRDIRLESCDIQCILLLCFADFDTQLLTVGSCAVDFFSFRSCE